MDFYYLGKSLFLNLLFIFLILGTTFVYFSKKMKEDKKKLLLFIKFVLFSIFIITKYTVISETVEIDNKKFISLKNDQKNLDFIFNNPNFKFKVKNNNRKIICLKTDLEKKKGLKIYYNENLTELKFLIKNLVKESSLEIINLKYLKNDNEEDWENNHANILQNLKMEILEFSQSKKILIFENLSLDLLKHNFLDLLIMFSNHFADSRFFILENKISNVKFIRRKFKYLNVFEIEEVEPEVFKSSIINIIMNSKNNKLSDVQAGRIAHDYYKENGANLKDLREIYEKYNKK